MEFKAADLQARACVAGRTQHERVLSAGFMCQNCPAISDDISTFIHEECACSFKEVRSPAARPAASTSPEHSTPRHAPLSIKKRSGRIGGEFMVLPCITPSAIPTPAEPTPITDGSMKRPAKETWREDVPAKTIFPGTPKLAKPAPVEAVKRKVFPKVNAAWEEELTPRKPHGPPSRSEVLSAIHVAQQELQQLLLLQALDVERKKLENLLVKKAETKVDGSSS